MKSNLPPLSGRNRAASTRWRYGQNPPRRGPFPTSATACRRKFLRFFPEGFSDPKYHAWERGYKWHAHEQWEKTLSPKAFQASLRQGDFAAIAQAAVRVEARTNLLFSFEKMALRDAVKTRRGAQLFAEGLFDLLHGRGADAERFSRWCECVASLPRKQTRVLTWPLVTVFGFLAQPEKHLFLKPMVTRRAATEYGFNFRYASRPSAEIYEEFQGFAAAIRADLSDLHPRDMIDLQSFIWVLGSEEYD